MRVFVSWSGLKSRTIAVLLQEWLPSVIQNSEVWVSSQNISKGDRWASVLGDSLATHNIGVLVMTEENLKAEWIMFEAGALSKSLSQSKVIPLLCGMTPGVLLSS